MTACYSLTSAQVMRLIRKIVSSAIECDVSIKADVDREISTTVKGYCEVN